MQLYRYLSLNFILAFFVTHFVMNVVILIEINSS